MSNPTLNMINGAIAYADRNPGSRQDMERFIELVCRMEQIPERISELLRRTANPHQAAAEVHQSAAPPCEIPQSPSPSRRTMQACDSGSPVSPESIRCHSSVESPSPTNTQDNRNREENAEPRTDAAEVSGSSHGSFSAPRRSDPYVRLHRVDRNGDTIETFETYCNASSFKGSKLAAIDEAMCIVHEAYESGFDSTRSSSPASFRFELVQGKS